MDDKEFTEKTRDLKIQFQQKAKFLKAKYQKEVDGIIKSIEERKLSQLRKELDTQVL